MPLADEDDGRRTFFADSALDDGLPAANDAFWTALATHVERDRIVRPRTILDIGCHTGGLLLVLAHRFNPSALIGIEPIAAAREAAARRLEGLAATVTLFDLTEWDRVPAGKIDLVVSHEVLYLERDVPSFMSRVRQALAPGGVAYVVLGCHAENPLWPAWKVPMVDAGHRVYDHTPLSIMGAASAAGLIPAVQPLRRSGWVTYDPLRADFRYPDVRTLFDHHYRHKLIFRFHADDDEPNAP